MQSRIDPVFFSALHYSVLEGKTSFTEAFRLTNTNNKTFWEMAKHREG
jgi:hypothetical protein